MGVMTNNVFTKCLRLMAFALCLCLSFNSVASAFVSAAHDTAKHGQSADENGDAPSNHHYHAAVVSAGHASGAVEHTNSDDHSVSNNCCDDGKDGCLSIHSACATHCAASVIDRTVFCFPAMSTTKYLEEKGSRRALSVNLAGPFKPPR